MRLRPGFAMVWSGRTASALTVSLSALFHKAAQSTTAIAFIAHIRAEAFRVKAAIPVIVSSVWRGSHVIQNALVSTRL